MSTIQLDKERIFIAGGSGMVGSSIHRAIIKSNTKISSKNILIPTKKELNLCDFAKVETWFKKNKPSIVIIAAAKVGGILANSNYPYEFILENTKIQNNLIEISWKYDVKKLIFLGSSCIYPKLASQPITENCLLTGPLEKTNEFYAIAKITGIKLCEALNIEYGFNSICLMPTNLYGEGDNYNPVNGHVIPSLIRKFSEAKEKNLKNVTCWGTGNPLREFLYVDDLAEACIFVLNNWDKVTDSVLDSKNKQKLNWINVGSQYEISINDLAEKISQYIGFKGNIIWDSSKPDGSPRKKLDTSKLDKLGWRAKISLDEGIISTLRHYRYAKIKKTLRIN